MTHYNEIVQRSSRPEMLVSTQKQNSVYFSGKARNLPEANTSSGPRFTEDRRGDHNRVSVFNLSGNTHAEKN
jgi:hypothetical protein